MRTIIQLALFTCLVITAFATQVTLPKNATFFSTSNNSTFSDFGNFTKQSVSQYDESSNKQYLIFANVVNHQSVLSLLTAGNDTPKQLIVSSKKQNYPVVNNQGDYAYSDLNFEVYLNGKAITTGTGLYQYLTINNNYLAFSYDLSSKAKLADSYVGYLGIYNLTTQQTVQYQVPGYIQKLVFWGNTLLAQVYNTNLQQMIVYQVNPATGSFHQLINNTESQFFYIDKTNLVIESISGNEASRIFFAALYNWKTHYMSNSFAHLNNYQARMTWIEAFWLQGLYALYQKTQSQIILDQIRTSIAAILSQAIIVNGKQQFWPTTEYSLQNDPLENTGCNAAIMMALTQAATAPNLLLTSTKSKIVQLAIAYYQSIEPNYLANEQLYRHTYGADQDDDGLWLPFNQQSMIGMMLINLYQLTDDEQYRTRVQALANNFKSQWSVIGGNRLQWQYSPKQYYQGWNTGQHISVHQPSRSPTTPPTHGVDTSHAALSVRFMERMNQLTNGQYLSSTQQTQLQNTLANMLDQGAQYGCEINSYKSGYRDTKCLPEYGWSLLNNATLNKALATMPPALWGPTKLFTAQLYAVHSPITSLSITLDESTFSANLSPVGDQTVHLTGNQMLTFFTSRPI